MIFNGKKTEDEDEDVMMKDDETAEDDDDKQDPTSALPRKTNKEDARKHAEILMGA